MRKGSTVWRVSGLVVLMLLGLVGTPLLWAQGQSASSIRGTVTDESGGVLPGVTVTLESPALLAVQSAVSDGKGQYRFDQLPVGTYKLTCELGGFQLFVREALQLAAGFSATVNVQMRVGSLQETVTVSGQSPVVDLTSTAASVNLPASVLADRLPITRTLPSVMSIAPGVAAVVPDLGGGVNATSTYTAYGLTGQPTALIDGVDTRRSSRSVETDYDMTSVEDFQMLSFGGNADKALGGIYMNAVIKSGGNTFSGRQEISYQDDSLEGNNLTDLMRSQGTTEPQLILSTVDYAASLGGPILQNRWWFFGAYHINRNTRTALGYIGKGGVLGSRYLRAQNFTGKSTFQFTPQLKMIGFYTRYTKWLPDDTASSYTVPYNSARTFAEPVGTWKVELQGTPSSRVFYSVMGGHQGYHADYWGKDESIGIPYAYDQSNNINAGFNVQQDRRTRQSNQFRGSMTYMPPGTFLGTHELQFGSAWRYEFTGTDIPNAPTGNYRLIYREGKPVQINVYNIPVTHSRMSMIEGGLYATDTWRVGERVTLNVGLRWDRFHNWIPAQVKEAGQFGPPWDVTVTPADGLPNDQTKVDVGTWSGFAPRLGFVWDLTGSGKTVVKGSYGKFNWTPGDDFASPWNINVATVTSYRWNGPCGPQPQTDGLWNANAYNCDYIPGTVNLDPNGPDFLSITSGPSGGQAKDVNAVLNPDLKEQYSNEFQLFMERELVADLAIRGGVSYLESVNLWQQVPYSIPFEAWNLPRTLYDRGETFTPSLTNTIGTPYVVYDMNPAYRGAAFTKTQFVNRSKDYNDSAYTYELTLTKRATGKWSAVASYSLTKYHSFVNGIPTNPNLAFFNADNYSIWQARISGSYDLPWGFDVSTTLLVQEGYTGARTVQVNLPNAGSVTRRIDERKEMGPKRTNMNLRVARAFRSGRNSFRVSGEVLNITNNASPYGMTVATGPKFGFISSTSTPIIARLGMSWSF